MPLLTALALAAAQAAQVPLAEACPKLSPRERAEIEGKAGPARTFPELAWYARDNCVSLAEAKRRMEIQNRDAIGAETEPGGPRPPPANSIGSLSQRLEAQEAATFAGIWIEHKPEYRVAVAFTRDAAKTLVKYTRDPLFKPVERPGPSQAELYATQRRVLEALQRYGARPSHGGSDIKRGTVEIAVTGDLAGFRQAVARGAVDLPAYVEIQEPHALAHPAPVLPAGWRDTVRAFPRYRYRSSGIELSILRSGTVVLEGGCLRLKGERRSAVIVWPNEAALDLTGGKVRVLNRMNGKSIELDRRVVLGGNARELADGKDVIDADPACPGPYYLMGNFEPYERFDEMELRNRSAQLQRERKLSPDAALAEARAERERQRELPALERSLARQAPDRFGGLWANPDGTATLMWVGDKAAGLARIPPRWRSHVRVQSVPRPIAALKADRDRLLDQFEAAGLKATASEEVIGGRILVQADDLPALSRAALTGKVRFPAGVTISTNGTGADGYSEASYQSANRVLEAAPDFAEIRGLIEKTMLPAEQRKDATWIERPASRAQSLDMARFLVALGFTANDIRLLRQAGTDPVRAWAMMNGVVGPEVRATVARDVAIGELVELIPERLGDGYRTTAVLRLAETLKGDRKAGETVRVRLVSGFDAAGKLQQANDEPLVLPGLPGSLDKGGRWLVFLSQGFTAHHARMNGGKARPGDLVSFWGLVGVDGERLDRRFALEWWPKDLARLRSALVPVDRAFDAANARAGGRLMTRTLD